MIEREQLVGSLLNKGFAVRNGSNHEKVYTFQQDGVDQAICVPIGTSRKYRQLGEPLCAAIKREMKLDTAKQLRQFSECTMSEDEYRRHLAAKFGPMSPDTEDC